MTILSRIIETKRAEVAARKATTSLAALDARIASVTRPRGFRAALDAKPGRPGYAVFGRVVGGMDAVRRILAQPTSPGGSGAAKGQMIARPVAIRRAVRLDGTARPSGRPKPWTLGL